MKSICATTLIVLVLSTFLFSCVSREYPEIEYYEETNYKTEYHTQAYTENETTVQSNSGEYPLTSFYSWHSSNIGFTDSSNISYYGYEIPGYPLYDNIRLRISIWPQYQSESPKMRVFDVSKTGQLSSPAPLPEGESQEKTPKNYVITGSTSNTWLKTANVLIDQARFLGGSNFIWSQPENPHIIVLDAGKATSIAIILTGLQSRWNGIFTIDVLWTKDIIEYRQVPGEKQVSVEIPYQVQKQRTVVKTKQVPIWESIFPVK